MKMLRIKVDVENTDHSNRQRRVLFCTWERIQVVSRERFGQYTIL